MHSRKTQSKSVIVKTSLSFWFKENVNCDLVNHFFTKTQQAATTYTCDNEGNIICQTGWKHSKSEDLLNPCSEPICTGGCINGICKAPEYCACEIGWEGANCEICLTLPGCQQGTCTNVFECNCEEKWWGAYCDIRKGLKNSNELDKFILLLGENNFVFCFHILADCGNYATDSGAQTGYCLQPNECM